MAATCNAKELFRTYMKAYKIFSAYLSKTAQSLVPQLVS